MKMRIRILIRVLVLIHVTAVRGDEEEAKLVKQSEPDSVTPVIEERSSHQHSHLVTSHHNEVPPHQGFWKSKLSLRPRWVKTWQEKKVYVAVWKRMWAPAVVKEWVPVPKPPPGWIKHDRGHYFIKSHH